MLLREFKEGQYGFSMASKREEVGERDKQSNHTRIYWLKNSLDSKCSGTPLNNTPAFIKQPIPKELA